MEEPFEPMPAEEQAPEEVRSETSEALESEACRNMLYGLLWCLGGVLFSFLSYYLTEAGGRYVVATGAIVWGALQAFKGLATYLQVKRAQGNAAACRRAILLAACTTVAVAGLGYASWRIAHAGEVRIVAEEQTYDCPGLRLRVRIPGGFTEVESEEQAETETTYARYRSFSCNDTLRILTEGTEGNLADDVRTAEDIEAFLVEEAEKFFDAGIDERTFVEIGGKRMLKHVGGRTQTPEWKTVMYDLTHEGSLITIYYSAQSDDPSREADAFVAEHVTLY